MVYFLSFIETVTFASENFELKAAAKRVAEVAAPTLAALTLGQSEFFHLFALFFLLRMPCVPIKQLS